MRFENISILGVGLLGGSIGMAIKSAVNKCKITGYGHRRKTLQTAVNYGAIDVAADSLAHAVRVADLIIICTPVSIFEPVLRDMAGHVRPGTVVTDVGSTKRSIVRLAERILPKKVHFVGSHPMAGSEKRGVEFARPDLFQNALCITTPNRHTNSQSLEAVERLWKTMGMDLVRLSPEDHDRYLADISHLPHAMAAALVAMQADAGLPLAGKGFLDTTRVAGGDGALWRDILLDNRDNMKASIARLKARLDELEELLDKAKRDDLADWLNRSSKRREALLRQKLREVNPD